MTGAKPSSLDSAYAEYLKDPTPDRLSDVVDHLSPVINYSVSSINEGSNALIKNKAKIFAAEAVKKFNPNAGAALPTWVSGQLMQLKRFKREVNQPVKVPERVQLDAYTLSRAEKEFYDKHNREPDVEELSDYAKIEALDYAYKDADKVDRKIIEMKTGYGGRYEPMPPNKIAAMLGLTPSQLTRRSIKLSLRIQEIEKNLQDIQ